jgi:folylpolyglutamate synthase
MRNARLIPTAGLAGEHQVQNASLAVRLAEVFLAAQAGAGPDPDTLRRALEGARWPGRCQVVRDPVHAHTRWFLDGAHTAESLECCMGWFVSPGVALSDDAAAPCVLPAPAGVLVRADAGVGGAASGYSSSTARAAAQGQPSLT